MKIFICCLILLIPTLAIAGSFPGGSSSVVGKDSRRSPNIIFLMLDDVGREQYPQLGSPQIGDAGSATFSGTTTLPGGLDYPLQVAGDFPNLDRLLANGINFTGMWSSSWCRASRDMLRLGYPGFGSVGTVTTKSHIQTETGNAYEIAHYGKNLLGAVDGSDENYVALKSGPPQSPIGGGGFAWNADGAGVLALPVSDAQLWTISATEIMFDDEMGIIQLKDYAEGFYGNQPPNLSNWFDNRTGQPFMLTISTYSAHGSGGTSCVQNRTTTSPYPDDYVVATTGLQSALSGLPFPNSVPAVPYGPTPSYNAADMTALRADTTTRRDWFKAWYDCQVTQMMFVDEQLGKLIDWLGPHGLENTLIVFTGDNGSVSDQIALRTGLKPPESTVKNAAAANSVIGIVGGPNDVPQVAGKNTITETGLNVAFVVGYGPIPQSLRGTSSAARLNFADVAETIVQVVRPKSSPGYFAGGRDFTSLLYGTAASQDSLFGSTIGFDPYGSPTGVSAVLDPDASGDVYRVLRWPGSDSANCDYVQNLTSPTWYDNIRGSAVQEVIDARAALDAAIDTAFPGNVYPEASCL